MSKEKQPILPALRFPEFVNDWEWKIRSLSSIAENLSNKRVPITSNVREKGKIPYYGATGVIDYVKDYIFNENLLLISEDGANLIDRNYLIAYSICGKTWVNNHAHVLKPISENIQTLIEKYINSISIEDYLTGQAQPKLNKANLNKIPIPLPKNPKEQQKIANCLSSLDNLITAETEKLALLKDHKKGLLQQLFPADGATKPQFRFKEFEGDGDWEEKMLGNLGEIVTGKTPSTKNQSLWNGKILFITPTDISDKKYQTSTNRTVKKTDKLKLLPKGSIVYTCIASIGKMAMTTTDSITNQQINSIVPFQNYENEFVYYLLISLTSYIKSIPATSTLPIINKNQFSEIKCKVPSNPKEQQKIATILSSADALIASQTEKIAILKDHKKGLLQQLFPTINALSI